MLLYPHTHTPHPTPPPPASMCLPKVLCAKWPAIGKDALVDSFSVTCNRCVFGWCFNCCQLKVLSNTIVFCVVPIAPSLNGKYITSQASQLITHRTRWRKVKKLNFLLIHCDVIMGSTASLIISVYSTVYSNVDHRKHQSSASLAFVRGIHRGLPAQMASNAENV